jgi:hypothetical protein
MTRNDFVVKNDLPMTRRKMVTKELSTEEMQVADAFLDLANPEAHSRAWNVLRSAETNEECLNLVMAVIQRAHLPEDEKALGLLGAGAMEDLMSDWLLDRLKEYRPFSQELRHCLLNVRMEFEPEALQQRLNRLRGEP